MKRSGPLARRTPMRRTGPLRRGRGNPIPQSSRDAVLTRSGGRCEAATPVCMCRAVHVHHLAGRSSHAPSNLLHVCSACHAFIHANPSISYQHGWLRRRNTKEEPDAHTE